MMDIVRLKPGTLDDTSVLQPRVHVWTCREQPWLEHYADLPKVERQADMASVLKQDESPY
jgi:hypothetical protein